jgi:hypothetical protein
MEWKGREGKGREETRREEKRRETLFQRINHKSYLTYGPRTILIFTGIKSIKDYDRLFTYEKKKKLVMNTITI